MNTNVIESYSRTLKIGDDVKERSEGFIYAANYEWNFMLEGLCLGNIYVIEAADGLALVDTSVSAMPSL